MTARIENEIWVQLNASQKKADLQVANIQQKIYKKFTKKIAVATVKSL